MRTISLLMVLILLSSCGSIQIRKKNASAVKSVKVNHSATPEVQPTVKEEKYIYKNVSGNASGMQLVETAKGYLGTPYKFGGTTSSGMDCSGLIYTSYINNGKKIARMSREQAIQGEKISLNDVQIGDLLFFNTSGKGISHVGMVEEIKKGVVYFIHSSTSKGVIISSLEESYWKTRFVQANRVN